VFRLLKTLHRASRPGSLVVALLAAAVVAAPASAQSCKAPPGMSAIDQYCEAIPSAGGDRGNADTDRGGLPISAQTRRELERRGADGRAIIDLSSAAKQKRATGEGSPSGTPAASSTDEADRPSNNPLSAISAGFGQTGDTAGPLFGTLLLVVALAFFGTAWLRYRRRAQG
jgi:hypothetical protein